MSEQGSLDERDSSARKIHEARVQELQQDLQILFDSVPAMIWYKDTQNRIVRVNQVAADSIRLPKDLIEGKAAADFYPAEADRYYRDDCSVIESGMPKLGIVEPYRLPSGEERWLQTDKVPLKNGAGMVTGILVMATDITGRKRAEEGLMISRDTLRHALEFHQAVMANMGEGLYTVDVQGLVTFMNQAAERLLGWTLSEVRGRTMDELIHKHRDGTPFSVGDCAGLKVLQEGKVVRGHEDVFIRKDGTFLDVSYSSSPLRAGDVISGLVVVFRDITDQKFTQAALRESEVRYRETFANAAVGIAHIGLDGRWVRFNDAICRITGYTREELQTKTFADITHPEDIEPDWANARRLLAGEIATYSMEKRYIQKGGGLTWINLTVSLQRDETGSSQNFISVIEDITARKQAQEAQHESEARFQTLADNMSQFAWMADATGWIFWYNRRWYEYTGTTYEDMQGWGWEKVHHPEHINRVVERWREAHATGEPWEDTFPLRGIDGSYRWFLSRAMPIRDSKGHVIRWLGTNTEITELRETQSALRASEQELKSFSSRLEGLVRERTEELVLSEERLRAMANELNLAEQRERKRLAGEMHDYLAQLLILGCLNIGQVRQLRLPWNADGMLKDTEEVLNKALAYSRTLMAELSPPALQDHGLVAALVWLGDQMRHRGLPVTVDVGNTIKLAIPEESSVLLFQSVRELLMNALKHAQAQSVTIRLEENGGRLRITVEDDGMGFDLATAGINSSSPTTALFSKFGLLSIRERMIALGGWFELRSEPGRGTTANVILALNMTPVSDAVQLPLGPPQIPPAQNQADSPIRVLLVDDHAMVRQGLRTLLESYGDVEIVGEACNGAEAVEMVERLQPSVVVMDINMPIMNGFKATQKIKSRNDAVIIIGLSFQSGGANEAAMKSAGASMLLSKAAAVEELHKAICESVGRRHE